MTEQEWLASTNPVAMLDWLAQHHKPSDRKLRLVACAVTRGVFRREGDLIWKIEEAADDPATDWSLSHWSNGDGTRLWCADEVPFRGLRMLCDTSFRASLPYLRDIIGNPFRPVTLPVGEECRLCDGTGGVGVADVPCLACHGTGHGPSPVLTPLVKSLAEAAYQERQEDGTLDPFRLGLLSDALEEAGMPEWVECPACDGDGVFEWGLWKDFKTCHRCDGTGRQPHPLLAHLREPGPHYRGCWAVDTARGEGR